MPPSGRWQRVGDPTFDRVVARNAVIRTQRTRPLKKGRKRGRSSASRIALLKGDSKCMDSHAESRHKFLRRPRELGRGGFRIGTAHGSRSEVVCRRRKSFWSRFGLGHRLLELRRASAGRPETTSEVAQKSFWSRPVGTEVGAKAPACEVRANPTKG